MADKGLRVMGTPASGVDKKLLDTNDGYYAEVVAAASAGAKAVATSIAVAASVSSAVEVRGRLIGGFHIPTSFEGGYLQFKRSADGENWSPVVDKYGAAIRYTAASGNFVTADQRDFVAVEYLQLVSTDASGVATVQAGAAASITVMVSA